MKYYPDEFSIPHEGSVNMRYADLSSTEVRKRDGKRWIGGDQGDVRFEGFDVEDGRVYLRSPVLVTSHEDLTEEEVMDMAIDIVNNAYDSIGVECFY